MKPISQAIRAVGRSGIREVFDLANQMVDVIHLEMGEPDFPTPSHVIEAAHRAAVEGHTKYTPNCGIPQLREALAHKIQNRNGVPTTPDRVVVTPGAIAGLYGSLLTLCDRGDQVLVPDPAWPNYRMIADLQGLEVVPYHLSFDDGFVPGAEVIEPLLTPRSRVLILNSPSNPTGAVVDTPNLVALLELAASNDVWVLSDEVYDEMHFEGSVAPSAANIGDPERIVTVWSFSKTYAMTGWRVGYLDAPHGIAQMLTKTEQAVTTCVNTPAQMAALAAVTGPQTCVGDMRDSYRQRRDEVVDILQTAGIPHIAPSGAFYMWIDVSAAGMSSQSFAIRLLTEAQVAVTQGSAFGSRSDGFVRVSLATEKPSLLEGVRRLAAAHQSWSTEPWSAAT